MRSRGRDRRIGLVPRARAGRGAAALAGRWSSCSRRARRALRLPRHAYGIPWCAGIALLALLASGCDGGVGRTGAAGSTGGAPPQSRIATGRVVATGRVEGWQEADVAAKLPGRVVRFDLEEGETIEAGAPVVVLEHDDLAARVRLAAARAREASLEHARVQALHADGIVAPSELDRAAALARVRAAELDEARAFLAYATVSAPFAGTLVRKLKEVGEGVAVEGFPDPLFRLADLSRLKVVAEVPEHDVGGVRRGQPAEVTADAYPGERLAATVERVGMAVGRKRLRSDDPRARIDEKVVEVELAMAADPRLKSGMTVTVAFGDAGGAEAARVPRAAGPTPGELNRNVAGR